MAPGTATANPTVLIRSVQDMGSDYTLRHYYASQLREVLHSIFPSFRREPSPRELLQRKCARRILSRDHSRGSSWSSSEIGMMWSQLAEAGSGHARVLSAAVPNGSSSQTNGASSMFAASPRHSQHSDSSDRTLLRLRSYSRERPWPFLGAAVNRGISTLPEVPGPHPRAVGFTPHSFDAVFRQGELLLEPQNLVLGEWHLPRSFRHCDDPGVGQAQPLGTWPDTRTGMPAPAAPPPPP